MILDFRTRPCIPTYHDGRWFDNDAHQKAHDHATGRTPLVNDGLHDEAARSFPDFLKRGKQSVAPMLNVAGANTPTSTSRASRTMLATGRSTPRDPTHLAA